MRSNNQRLPISVEMQYAFQKLEIWQWNKPATLLSDRLWQQQRESRDAYPWNGRPLNWTNVNPKSTISDFIKIWFRFCRFLFAPYKLFKLIKKFKKVGYDVKKRHKNTTDIVRRHKPLKMRAHQPFGPFRHCSSNEKTRINALKKKVNRVSFYIYDRTLQASHKQRWIVITDNIHGK